jgi:hypothetical protein
MSSRDEPGGCLLIGQVVSGVIGGASPVCGSCRERGKAGADTTVAGVVLLVGVRGSARDGGSRRRGVPMRHGLADRLVVVVKPW